MQSENKNHELSGAVFEAVPQLMRVIRAQMKQAVRDPEHALTFAQYRVMAQLSLEPHSNKALAEAVGMSVPAMSRLIEGLVKRGWVSRAVHFDRRKVELSLSVSGRRKFAEIQSGAQTQFAERFAGLSDKKRRALAAGLEVLRSSLANSAPRVLIAFLGFSLLSSAGAMTLEEAVKVALEHNPSVLAAREKVNEASKQLPLAVSAVLPSLGLRGSAETRKDPANSANPLFLGTDYNNYSFELQAVQPLWDGGAFIGLLGAAKRERQIKEAELAIAERSLGEDVISSFYGVLFSKRKLAILVKTKETTEQLLKVTRERERIGRSKHLDVLQIQTQLASLAPQMAQAEAALKSAAASLANLQGEARVEELEVTGSLDPQRWLKRFEEQMNLSDSAPKRSFEMQRAELLREQVGDRKWVVMAKHWPTLSLQGGWGRNTFTKVDLLSDYATYWRFGLQLSVPLFSGLSSVHERGQLASQEEQAAIESTRLRNVYALSIVQSQDGVKTARATLSASEETLSYAQESLREAQKEYRLATIGYADLLQVQKAAFEAEVGFEKAKYDLIVAVVVWADVQGRPLL